MKPDWKDAPEWALYLAQDDDGDWYWYARDPVKDVFRWSPNGGQCELASIDESGWGESKESRP